MEYWAKINNNYSVSTMGRMWSAKVGVMKTPILNTGYPHLNLMIEGRPKRVLVHRLMALAFLPNPENKPTVNHKNGIRADNRIENLEWATSKEQNIHSVEVLKVSEWHMEDEESDKPCFKEDGKEYFAWVSGYLPATEAEYLNYLNSKK